MFILKNSCFEDLLKEVSADSYNRLIFSSIERILHYEAQHQNQEILEHQVCLPSKPKHRQIAVINELGSVLDTTVIYPTPPQNKIEEAEERLKLLIDKHNVNVLQPVL